MNLSSLLIEAAKEALILIGDLNKLIGNGEHGVKGNNDKVSHGGKLIHNLLSGGKYMLVNNSEKCTGAPSHGLTQQIFLDFPV